MNAHADLLEELQARLLLANNTATLAEDLAAIEGRLWLTTLRNVGLDAHPERIRQQLGCSLERLIIVATELERQGLVQWTKRVWLGLELTEAGEAALARGEVVAPAKLTKSKPDVLQSAKTLDLLYHRGESPIRNLQKGLQIEFHEVVILLTTMRRAGLVEWCRGQYGEKIRLTPEGTQFCRELRDAKAAIPKPVEVVVE